jgi:hypothetical protein
VRPSRTARLGLLGLLVAGCSGQHEAPARETAPPRPLAVEVAGCAAIRRAPGPDADRPVCDLAPERTLRLFVPADAAAPVLTGAAGSLAPGAPSAVTIAAGTSELEVTAGPARFALRVETPPAEPVLDELTTLRKARRFDEARARLDALLAAPPPALQGRLHGHAARLALAAGDAPGAVRGFEAALPLHARDGRLSDFVNDALALAFVQIHQTRDFAGARRTLDAAVPHARFDPEGAAAIRTHRARLALETGDVRSALRALDDAEPRLERLGATLRLSVARQARAEALQAAGRHAEAVALLRTMRSQTGTTPCALASVENDLGWARMREAGDAPPTDAGEVDALFAGVLRAFGPEGACPRPAYLAGAHLNRALLALRLGDAPGARAALAAGRAALPASDARLALWWPDVEGRAALLAGEARAARAHFERLRTLGAATASAEAQWRGAIGLARAAELAGDDAGPAYAEAFERLADQALRIPVAEGREHFLAEGEAGTRDFVEYLVRRGRTSEAMAVVRRARGRFLAALRQAERLPGLSDGARGRWETAIADYHRARAALDAEAADDWSRPADALAAARAARAEREKALHAALDAAFAVLADPASAGSGGVAPLAMPAPGEVFVTWFEGRTDTLVFTADAASVSVARVPRGADAAALLAPVHDRLSAARRLRLLPHGPTRSLDLHAAPFDGTPLVARLPVVYGLDLPPLPAGAPDPRTLLVADPRGDLPGARTEGEVVAAALGATPLIRLVGAEATGAAVRRGLGEAGRFHYAGHGRFGGASGWESVLPLAADGALTIHDILALPRVPALVVLSGCETARQAEAAPLELLGLAQAFLAAGAGTAIAATRPVADALATELSADLYRALTSAPPDEALRTAQLASMARSEARDWAAFRLLVR